MFLDKTLEVQGVIEVKSAVRPALRVREQLDRHLERLHGGVRLDGHEWSSKQARAASRPIQVVVQPATWKLDRSVRRERWKGQPLTRAIFHPNDDPEMLVLPETSAPTEGAVAVVERSADFFVAELRWSEEALAQAA